MFLRWRRWWNSPQEAALRRPQEGGEQLWTGERRQREGTPPSQVAASHLLHGTAASHPPHWSAPKRAKKPTVLHPVTQQAHCFDDRCSEWNHAVFKKNLYKRRSLSCAADTFVCWGTTEISNQVKRCIKYEWVGVRCVYKSQHTITQRGQADC